jgi:hypothetical protein
MEELDKCRGTCRPLCNISNQSRQKTSVSRAPFSKRETLFHLISKNKREEQNQCLKIMRTRVYGCGLVVECLPNMHKALGSIPNTTKQTNKNKK